MTIWVFMMITVLASALAAFSSDKRRAILFLWLAGLGAGCVFLAVGAELLGVAQWIVSTLVAVSFLFFASMFGEYHQPVDVSLAKKTVDLALPVAIGAIFSYVIWLGVRGVPTEPVTTLSDGTDLVAVGRSMLQHHLLSLEVLALMLFLVLVGTGVIARPERK